MSGFLTLLSVIAGFFLTLAFIYLFFWAVVFFIRPNKAEHKVVVPKTRFAFVVPAHNEEHGIKQTLQSLMAVDYPHKLFDVVVVADNCDDETASIAKAAGAVVLERYSDEERGKGFALKFAFQTLLPEDYDAFVVIDADSAVDSNFLAVIDEYQQSGYEVVQTLDGILNPDASPLTYLFHVGNVLENYLFYEAKWRLGIPALLRGNGMCFSRQVLERFPWTAFSIVEDTEYTIKLIRASVDIPFATQTRVLAQQPETIMQAYSQRVRWASGNMKITKGYALDLIREGITKKQIFLIDAGCSLLVMSKPLLIAINMLMIGLATLNVLLFKAGGIVLAWALSLFFGFSVYLASGVMVAGVDRNRLFYLVSTPVYLGWMLYVSLLGLVGYRSSAWVRTKRP